MRRLAIVVGGAVTLAVFGAGALGPPGYPAAAPASLPGKAVYEQHCAVCHGATGEADGPGAASLPIRPPSFRDGWVMNPLPVDFVYTVIRDGAGAVGLAPQMPGFGRILSERQIRDVIVYVRSMAEPPYRPEAAPVAVLAPAPRQPIEFSHVVHAGSYRIDCQYCHADARRSAYAGLPSVARCLGCHKIVAAQGNPEVQKIQAHWTRQEPIRWVRLHKVLGYVYFPHKRHVQQGVACQTCHGAVERMQRVAQVAPLTMGWCINCHAEQRGPLDCVACHH